MPSPSRMMTLRVPSESSPPPGETTRKLALAVATGPVPSLTVAMMVCRPGFLLEKPRRLKPPYPGLVTESVEALGVEASDGEVKLSFLPSTESSAA